MEDCLAQGVSGKPVPVTGLLVSLTLIGSTVAGVAPQVRTPTRAPTPAAAHAPARTARSAGHPASSTHATLKISAAKLLGQRIMVGMDGTYPSASLLRRRPRRARRLGDPVRREHRQPRPALGADRRPAGGRPRRRQSAAADRDRPGGRPGQAAPERPAGPLAAADRGHREQSRSPIARAARPAAI